MQPFDCLALECPLFGSHLLEASAGTGKTFSIEHIFVRLILESLEVEQILAVTFTRAATRELKARIRANLEKALVLIIQKEAAWDYLAPHLGSDLAIQRLSDALSSFDRCQIFTIHSFCYRMLKEFAFEAMIGSISNPDKEKKVPDRLKYAVCDFLENGIDSDLLCPEQLALLLKEFESLDELKDRLLNMEKRESGLCFSKAYEQCKAALQPWNLQEKLLLEDFFALQPHYKVSVKGNFELQVKGLVDSAFFPSLLKEKGSLFDFLDPLNRKVKAQNPQLHYPGFFEWARLQIAPLFKQKVFPILQAAWNPIAEQILLEEEYLNPDEILIRMKKACENMVFANCVRQKYAAAIIDEFQDTDAVQWEVFQSLFLAKSLRALYLVGDPKQSIYRFRKADVYTYLKARDFLGEENLYQLDTNFRSSKSLIGALNALFARDWLRLPKANRTLPYHSVKAGVKIESTFPDEKGAIHFFYAEGDALFDEAFLPFAVQEIERLHLKSCAILVKDRYQSERALEFLKKRGIPAVAKSSTPLGQTVAFQMIRELFEAILSPHDPSLGKVVLAGPFANIDLLDAKALLEEKGLVPFARKLQLDADSMQIFERLFEWEKRAGFSFEGLKRKLSYIKELDPEEGGRRRMEANEEAVQIMTLHISKGLEFDVVFALGLSTRTPKGDEELDAEKLRQLYVAMTRAKKRLYIPLSLSQKEAEPGTQSPMELFSSHFTGSFLDHLSTISKSESITVEALSLPFILGPPLPREKREILSRPPLRPFKCSFLSSFTTLAKGKDSEIKWVEGESGVFNLQTMPRGAETGVEIHQILEKLFRSQMPIWRDPIALDSFVEEQLHFSFLSPWKKTIQQMVRQILSMPLIIEEEFFSLSEVNRFQVEAEFVFSSPPHFIKGFIDLIFPYRNKVYFIDWKTNWLENYDPASLQKAMEAHDYGLQADLYAEAVKRHFNMEFGGSFFIFIRGCAYVAKKGM